MINRGLLLLIILCRLKKRRKGKACIMNEPESAEKGTFPSQLLFLAVPSSLERKETSYTKF